MQIEDDCLITIYTYLSKSDMLKACFTCTHWINIALHPFLWQDYPWSTKSIHFFYSFAKLFGDRLKFLYLNNCRFMTQNVLNTILQMISIPLEQLVLTNCDSLTHLYKNEGDKVVLERVTQYLKVVSFEDCPRLEKIHIQYLLNLCHLTLEELNLVNSGVKLSTHMKDIKSKDKLTFPNVHTLYLGAMKKISQTEHQYLINHFPKLNTLVIDDILEFTKDEKGELLLNGLNNFQNLKSIEIKNTEFQITFDWNTVIDNLPFNNITEFCITDCCKVLITPNQYKTIVTNCYNLKKLCIISINKSTADYILSSIVSVLLHAPATLKEFMITERTSRKKPFRGQWDSPFLSNEEYSPVIAQLKNHDYPFQLETFGFPLLIPQMDQMILMNLNCFQKLHTLQIGYYWDDRVLAESMTMWCSKFEDRLGLLIVNTTDHYHFGKHERRYGREMIKQITCHTVTSLLVSGILETNYV
jgi:hypothetical protein